MQTQHDHSRPQAPDGGTDVWSEGTWEGALNPKFRGQKYQQFS